MNKLKVLVATLLVATLGFVGYNALQGDSAQAAETAECGDNSIMRCGAMTAAILQSKYAANDRSTQAIFSYYNISASDVAGAGSAKIGYVNPDGTVTVDGKVVATGMHTVGRSASLGGSAVNANGVTVYEGAGRLKSTLSAYVFFNADGTFKSAVLRVCGNPVKAIAVPKPVYACNTLTPAVISRLERSFTTTTTAQNGASISGYTYNFGDGSSANGGPTISHTYAKSGTYTVSVVVHVTVDGANKDVTSDGCKTTVTISPEPIQVCDLATNTVITINKEDFNSTKHSANLSDCDKVKYCDTATKTIVTVATHDKKDTYTTDYDKCNTTVCRISDKTTVTLKDEDYQAHKDVYTTDFSKCAPNPPVLPHTGIGDVIGSTIGLGALTLAGYYYIVSRRMV